MSDTFGKAWGSVSNYFELTYPDTLNHRNDNPAKFEPTDGKIYHGVGWGKDAQIQYENMFTENHKPFLFQNTFSLTGGARPITVANISQMLNPPHINNEKQVAELSIHIYDFGPIDSLFAYTTQYDNYIDSLAEALQKYNKPVFLRIGLEVNGPWNGYTPWIFPKAFRKLVLELRSRKLDNIAFVWCYEPDAVEDFADSTSQGWKWYPGDDVVDWFGLDLFDATHFDQSLPDSINGKATKKGRSELFMKFAEKRGKPVYLNELSAQHTFITPDQNDPDSSDGKHDWNLWFDPFFKFLDNHPRVKAFNYINLNWSTIDTYATWGDARIEINSYIKNKWVEKLSDPKFLNFGTELSGTTDVQSGNELPLQFVLYQNYPNPFNPETVISYQLSAAGFTSIKIYDILGKHVSVLVSEYQQPGKYKVIFNGQQTTNYQQLPSGIYFYRLTIGNYSSTRKMLLLK